MKNVKKIAINGFGRIGRAAFKVALANPKLKVVATLTDLGWIAERVGGEDAEVVVLCPGCNLIRIDGRDDDATVSRFQRGRAALDRLYWGYAAILGFSAVVWIGGAVLGETTQPAVVVTTAVAVIGWVAARNYRTASRPRCRSEPIGSSMLASSA